MASAPMTSMASSPSSWWNEAQKSLYTLVTGAAVPSSSELIVRRRLHRRIRGPAPRGGEMLADDGVVAAAVRAAPVR